MNNNSKNHADSEANSSAQSLSDDILVKLLKIASDHDKKVDQLEKAIGADGTNLYLDGLLDIVLDVLGVPADNTVETNAVDIANTTGVWPEGSYCRDLFYDEWWDVRCGESEVSIDNFPAWVRGQLNSEPSHD